jgi:hypothetical protein
MPSPLGNSSHTGMAQAPGKTQALRHAPDPSIVNKVQRRCAHPEGCSSAPFYGNDSPSRFGQSFVVCGQHRARDHRLLMAPRCSARGCRRVASRARDTNSSLTVCAEHLHLAGPADLRQAAGAAGTHRRRAAGLALFDSRPGALRGRYVSQIPLPPALHFREGSPQPIIDGGAARAHATAHLIGHEHLFRFEGWPPPSDI